MIYKRVEPEVLMSVDEVAAWLNVSIYTVRRYIKTGKIKAKRLGKHYRVFPDSVRVFLTMNTDASVKETETTP